MRNAILFMLIIGILCFIQCEKSDSMGPKDQDTVEEVGTFIILPHGVETTLPHEVHLICNVIDTSRTPVDFLTASRFSIKENGISIDEARAGLTVRKRNSFNYQMNTVLLLDVSTGINLDTLKKAATAFVNDIDPMHSIAIHVFSGTLNIVQDFTSNSGQLISAINGITTVSAERNLYGAIWQAFNLYSESYSLGFIRQGNLVVFTAGDDTENEKTKEEVIYSTQFINVYTIGLGNSLDRNFLVRAGNRGYFIASNASQLVDAFTQAQESISKFMDSYYCVSYQSSLRGTESQEVEMSITANAYGGSGSTMKNTFDASLFEDLEDGITINWTSAVSEGVDALIIGVDIPRTVSVLSQGGNAVPVYEWSSADPEIMSVEPLETGFPGAILVAESEGNTHLIIKDTANGFEKSIQIQIVQSYNGFVLREWWNNISGSTISDLTSSSGYPDIPSGREYINTMDGPVDSDDNYGSRLRGFVSPDVRGTYSFWIASDDNSQLFLSMNENPDQKILIASVDDWTNHEEYTKFSSQHSASFELEAGKYYYIEAIHKEGEGGDNLSVAWQGPDITRSLIPSQNLSAWLGD